VLAVVSPTLGLLWLDHRRNIRRISKYLAELWHWEPSWEKHIREHPPPGTWSSMYWTAMFVMFVAAPVAALVLVWPGDGDAGRWTLWCGGAALTALYAGAYASAVRDFASWPISTRNPSHGAR
jgi:hypothetical protein